MKKAIKGKIYDTETAVAVGQWDNGYPRSDFTYCEETLYRKRTGEYFLYGEGGANSRYGDWRGNSGSWGESIRPYTYAEATKWSEEHLTGDEYLAEFGDPDESTDKLQMNLTILPATRAKLEKIRAEKNQSFGQIIDELVEKH